MFALARSKARTKAPANSVDEGPASPALDFAATCRLMVANNRFLPIPKEEERFVGDGDFRRIGAEFLELFIRHGGLRPEWSVLDLGCGIGRMALPLTQYLAPETCYTGLDVNKRGIEWCRRRISRVYKNFSFVRMDYGNSLYNPTGTKTPAIDPLPFPPSSFDFAIATSVFTHLARHETKAFLRQLATILRPGGRLFATFFLLDEISVQAMQSGQSRLKFQFDGAENIFEAVGMPVRSATALKRDYLETLLAAYGYRVRGDILRGTWSGFEGGVTYQDVVVAERVENGGGAANASPVSVAG